MDRHRGELRALFRARDDGRACACSIHPTRRKSRSASAFPNRRLRSGTGFCPTRGRTSSTVTASTARTTRNRVTVSIPTRLSWIHTRNRSPARSAGPTRCSGTGSGDPRCGSVVRRSRQRGVRAARGRHRPGVHVGRRPAAPHTVVQDRHLRDARTGLLRKLHPDIPEHLRRHLRSADDVSRPSRI